jgi:hypothetical protein
LSSAGAHGVAVVISRRNAASQSAEQSVGAAALIPVTAFSDALTIQPEQRVTSGAAGSRSLTIRPARHGANRLGSDASSICAGDRDLSRGPTSVHDRCRGFGPERKGCHNRHLCLRANHARAARSPGIALDHDQGFPDLAAALQKKLIVWPGPSLLLYGRMEVTLARRWACRSGSTRLILYGSNCAMSRNRPSH